jgi:hypothetical protein
MCRLRTYFLPEKEPLLEDGLTVKIYGWVNRPKQVSAIKSSANVTAYQQDMWNNPLMLLNIQEIQSLTITSQQPPSDRSKNLTYSRKTRDVNGFKEVLVIK